MAQKKYPNVLRFDINPPEIKTLSEKIIEESKKTLDEIVKIPSDKRTFQNTVHAFDTESANFGSSSSSVTFPAHVSSSKELRDASNEAANVLSSYEVEKVSREDLYKAILDYKEKAKDEVAKLQGEDLRLLNKTIEQFERVGLGLSEDKRKRMTEIKKRMSELSIQFSQNLNEESTKLHFTKEELAGLPEDFFEPLKKNDEGKYILSLKYPDLFPVMEHCTVESTRKQMEFANSSKCMDKNVPLLEETLRLREEEAKLLGYSNHADFELALRMAKNKENVLKFLDDLNKKLEKPAHRDLESLRKLKVEELKKQGNALLTKMKLH